MVSDIELMRRALDLAARGRGRVEPNPMVGCVIIRDARIIGEGCHEQFGGPHAEINALTACNADPAGGAAFVTLEPCCHANKKTPPCTRALIAARLSRVVAASADPNPMVSGRGLDELRRAGIVAEEGLLAAEAKQLNAAYFKRVAKHQPYVTLKWAETADGKVAAAGGQPLAISNSMSLKIMHQLRGRCDAILAGIGTVLADDPLLTARDPNAPRIPLRIVLDSNLRIGVDSRLIQSARQFPLWVCCGESANQERADALSKHGAEIIRLRSDPDGGLALNHLLDELGKRRMTHLLVEPGPKLAASFLRQNLADRVWIFRSPRRGESSDAPAAAAINFPKVGSIPLDGDELSEYLNPASPAYYSSQPSADFQLSATGI